MIKDLGEQARRVSDVRSHEKEDEFFCLVETKLAKRGDERRIFTYREVVTERSWR